MPRVQLFGDPVKAGAWIGWAKKKILSLKGQVPFSGLNVWRKDYQVKDVLIELMHSPGGDKIRIRAVAGGGGYIIAHVGSDTGANGYNRKIYRLDGTTLIGEEDKQGREFTSAGIRFTDDGKYFMQWGGTTYDDPDDYTYMFNPDGIVAENVQGTAVKKQDGQSCRFALNQSHEEEFYVPYITDVDGTDRSYLVLFDSLTYRPYKIKGNPVFTRYTDDALIYLAERTIEGVGSVLLIERYNSGVADGFGDDLFTINKLWDKKIALDDEGATIKSSKTVNDGANGAALYGATKFYEDRRTDQELGRVKTFTLSTFDFSEWAVKEDYGQGTEQKTYKRCTDGSNTCFFMRGRTTSGSVSDPQGNILEVGFNTIANIIKLPYSFTDTGAETYIEMVKNDSFSVLNTGLYVAGQLIEESGIEPVIMLGTGEGGVVDSLTGKWVMERNGPIVIKRTEYNILHDYHDGVFNAAIYRKTVYVSDDLAYLPYRKSWALGEQAQQVDGQIKRYEVRSLSTYHIVVNGVITDLPYSFTAREYTLTADVVDDADGGHPLINQWIDLPWVDVGYDAAGSQLEETNRQLSRVFTTAADNSLLISFDIWDTKSKHDLIYDDSNPAYKYLWAEYDTALGTFPPLIDLLDIETRKWMRFDTSGEYEEIDTPKVDGIDYERVNGLLMVNI
ncbi:hypothetical protein KAR91_43165 [Candidatus Pacearchaeota archaeon]|nr:hypothetical protein [Candidatus Pacearchaeota archaeon]